MGGDASEPAQDAGDQIQRPPIAGEVEVQRVNCRDWRRSSPAERGAIIEALREFAGGPSGSPAGRGRTLPDDRAYDLLQRACSREFARGFKLYKLYTRAAAFQKR